MTKQIVKDTTNSLINQYAYAPDLVDDTFYVSKKHKETIFSDPLLRCYYRTLCQITYHWLTIPFPEFDVKKPSEHISALAKYADSTFNEELQTDIRAAVFMFQNITEAVAEAKLVNSEKSKKDAS